jgi:hypothetical protein
MPSTRRKAFLSKLSRPDWEQVVLQLFDGCGSLASLEEVEVAVTVRRRSGGGYTASTRGLFWVYPYLESPGWYKLVSRTRIKLERGGNGLRDNITDKRIGTIRDVE